MDMRDSSTYQAILEEGRQEGRQEGRLEGLRNALHWMLLRQGRRQLGLPSDATMVAIIAITDVERLLRMSEHLIAASTWDELLATP